MLVSEMTPAHVITINYDILLYYYVSVWWSVYMLCPVTLSVL